MQDLLLDVRKPGRYIGAEFNTVLKDKAGVEVKFAFCFPDFYEVGMSNLGLRIIYGLLNKRSDCLCERFFLPDLDMQNIINSAKADFVSLESKSALSEFDIVGFSLSHELGYTNVLNILKLAKLPFFSKERNEGHPLIIGGGPALGNPEPMADFFDLFLIGEAEEVLAQLIDEFKIWRNKLNRSQLLQRLSGIAGVYVPAIFEPEYNNDGSFKSIKPKLNSVPQRVQRRFIRDLDSSFYPVDWIVPYVSIAQDRILLELMRGCPHACYFCQARNFYSPFRIKSKEQILKLALKAQEKSGYEELSLLGLSSSDHPDIQEIVESLIENFNRRCVNISLGSLRPTLKVRGLLEKIVGVRKTGLTLAIESASDELRRIINKGVDLEALKQLISFSYKHGYKRIKLYFMFGLPFETQEDLEAIPELIYELAYIENRFRRDLNFTLSLNPFVPKPHTVFQWHAMEKIDVLKRKQEFLKSAILRRMRNVKLDFHNLESSLLEGLLCRGDRRLSGLILKAFENGAMLDSYSDYFNFSCWQRALEETGLDLTYYANRNINLEEKLPWGHIDIGISTLVMKDEYRKVVDFASNRIKSKLD